MKKLTVCALALAVMTFAMTSCNKEESNVTPENINAMTESNALLNEVKTHTVQDSLLFWDEGDRICITDGSSNSAIYEATQTGGTTSFRFVRYNDPRHPFDVNNGNLYAVYPYSIGNYTNDAKVKLPEVEWTNTGDVEGFPMVGTGALNEFRFRNICGVFRMTLTAGRTIDSISITTDKFVAGYFTVNTEFPDNDNLSYYVTEKGYGHGAKTVTLKFRNGLVNPSAQKVIIYLPATTYNVFDITFYSNGQKLVKRNINPITIQRTQAQQVNMTLNSNGFAAFNYGLTSGQFKVANNSFVRFATGNLQFIGISGVGAYWRIADNQFDTYTTAQTGKGGAYTMTDRDIFAFGANGYGTTRVALGNAYKVWGSDNRFEAAPDFTSIANLRNAESGMRVLTSAEWEYLLDHQTNGIVCFNGINGLMVLPQGTTLTITEGATISKTAYNQYMNAGAAFFPINKYRNETSRRSNGVYNYANVSGESYYWTANSGWAAGMNLADVETLAVNNGAYVRLVKDVE